MLRSTFVLFGVLVGICVVGVRGANADGVNTIDQYNVSGTLTITGNDACTPLLACAETLNFSFVMGSEDESSSYGEPTYIAYALPGATVESLGPLGEFALLYPGPPGTLSGTCGSFGDCNYVEFWDAEGDEIDIHLESGIGSTPITPVIVSTDIYRCGSATCVAEFTPPDQDGNSLGIFNFGEVVATATPVPEPSSLPLLGIGLAGLALMANRKAGLGIF